MRATYHHGDLQQTLIREAILMLSEGGVSGLSMRALARRVGVSHAAPSYHFGNKERLLATIAGEGFAQLAAAMESSAPEQESAMSRFESAGVAYVKFASEHPAQFRLMFQPEAFEGDYPEKLKYERLAFKVLTEATRASIPCDVGLDIEATALAAWSAVHGLAMLWLDGPLRLLGGRTGQRFETAQDVSEKVLSVFRVLLSSYVESRCATTTGSK